MIRWADWKAMTERKLGYPIRWFSLTPLTKQELKKLGFVKAMLATEDWK